MSLWGFGRILWFDFEIFPTCSFYEYLVSSLWNSSEEVGAFERCNLNKGRPLKSCLLLVDIPGWFHVNKTLLHNPQP